MDIIKKVGTFFFNFEHLQHKLENKSDQKQDHPQLWFYMRSHNMPSKDGLIYFAGLWGSRDRGKLQD